MTQEEKNLLLKDLCARIPYEVIVETYWDYLNKKTKAFPKCTLTYDMLGYYIGNEAWKSNIHFLPFLRPISSLTEEEIKIARKFNDFHYYDYLNSIHIDYRGLIEKNLALEAPEDMYNS